VKRPLPGRLNALRRGRGALLLGLAAGLLVLGLAGALGWSTWRGHGAADAPVWRTAFLSALHAPIPGNPQYDDAGLRFRGISLRQFVPLALPAGLVRLQFGNEYGERPLVLGEVRVAWRAGATGTLLQPGTDRAVSFAGVPHVSIPPGRSVWSDPVSLPPGAPADLAVSLLLLAATPRASWHLVGGRSSYLSAPGRHLGEEPFPVARVDRGLFFLAAVEAEAPRGATLWVAFGDSITDGAWHTVDTDTSYPAVWARLWADRRPAVPVAVLNAGIGGNRLLDAGHSPAGLARLERDVFNLAGVHGLVVLIGINDLGVQRPAGTPPVDAERLIAGHTELLRRARAHGLKVVGATLLPVKGSAYFRPEVEAARQGYNRWVRGSTLFDAVVDFDAVVRDPVDPLAIRADWTDDHVHPTDAGYRAMAEALVRVLDQAGLAPPARPTG
jgi:lysophospholipase L1-like esterase